MNKSLFVVLAIALFCFSAPFVGAQTDSTTSGVPAAADNSTNTNTTAPAAAVDSNPNTTITDDSGAAANNNDTAAPATETTETAPQAAIRPTVVSTVPVASSSEETGEVEVTVAEDGSVIGSSVESDPNAVTVDNTESGAVTTQDSADNSATTATFLAMSGSMVALSGVVVAMSAVLLI